MLVGWEKSVRGSPAGITTMSQPSRVFWSPSSVGRYPFVTWGGVIFSTQAPEPDGRDIRPEWQCAKDLRQHPEC